MVSCQGVNGFYDTHLECWSLFRWLDQIGSILFRGIVP